MKKVFLEIVVDKKNEKWPWVFEHILIVLHNVFEEYSDSKNFSNSILNQLSFSFEIVKLWNNIRFFIISIEKYKEFLKNQIYAHFNNINIIEVDDYLAKIPNLNIQVWIIWLAKHFVFPIKTFTEIGDKSGLENVDPFNSIISSLSKTWDYTLNAIQVNFSPVHNSIWKKEALKIINIISSSNNNFIKKILLNNKMSLIFKIFIYPLLLIYKVFSFIFTNLKSEDSKQEKNNDEELESIKILDKNIKIPRLFMSKLSKLWFNTNINIIYAWEEQFSWRLSIKEIFSTFWMFTWEWINSFILKEIINDEKKISIVKERKLNHFMILNTSELSAFVHLPNWTLKTPWINWINSHFFEAPVNLPVFDEDIEISKDLTPIWRTNFRNTNIKFWIWSNDRRRHMYIIWKTWMWKSTLLENMIIDDIKKGRWIALIDPHGDLVESIIWNIPKNRTNQSIIFDLSDLEFPISFNLFDNVSKEHHSLISSWIISVFKKIFWDSWGPRLEHLLRNTILALLEYPESTIISIPLMLTNEVYRMKVIDNIKDPIVKKFWTNEYAKMNLNQQTEASWPVLNKVGQFLSSPILRNILWQTKNTFNIRWVMDNSKILIINLSKWKIWEDASFLLWAMLVIKIQIDAMSRADIKENDRKDFYLYVDEFQNFTTDAFSSILSEARKYKLNLVIANQYIDQIEENIRAAIFWNVWTLISFQVGHKDASYLKEEYWILDEEDLINLSRYNIYLKQLINWIPSPVFSASTLAPYPRNEKLFYDRYKKILQVSREKYSKPKSFVEEKINNMLYNIDKFEQEYLKKKKEFEEKKRQNKLNIKEYLKKSVNL